MYVRHGIRFRHVLADSWRLLVLAFGLSVFVYLVHEFFGFEALEVPALPVATIGIVVSLYLGFLSTSAYNRWWEARTIWGEIVNNSRIWGNYCLSLPDAPTDDAGGGARQASMLVRRHLAWVNALCFQLRSSSRRLPLQSGGPADTGADPSNLIPTRSPDRYLGFLAEADAVRVKDMANPAVHIIRLQSDALAGLRRDGFLDQYRFVEMCRVLSRLYDCQGQCERIKNTPFPIQFTYFGRIFTWLLIILLPFAFVDSFVRLAENHPYVAVVARDYVFLLIPFNMLISWIFFLLGSISESCGDPFEGGPTDVPISTLTRLVEIDLLQMLGDEDIPPPCRPRDGALY